jgi:lactaldehyde dehydrogenase/glycolaldehyde dehydrogenase
VADQFLDRFVAVASKLRMGDPLQPDTELGPKITKAELDKVTRMVAVARENGAEVVLGGGRPEGEAFDKGFWLAPTVLTGVTHDMDIMRDEVFGPVAAIMTYDDLDEAVALANDTKYGLSAYIYGNDLRATMQLVDRLTCGEIYVNNVGPEQVQGYHSGTGLSGYGGDDGPHGLERYRRRKSVYVTYA